MPYADWEGATRDLACALARLADTEFLILGESSAPAQRRGIFGRQSRSTTTRFVQAMRVDDVLSAECVGAASLGGTWAMDEGAIARLCGLGWLTPAEIAAEYGHSTPNFELYADLADAAPLADLMVTSLAVLGAEPGALVLQSSPEGLSALSG